MTYCPNCKTVIYVEPSEKVQPVTCPVCSTEFATLRTANVSLAHPIAGVADVTTEGEEPAKKTRKKKGG